MKLNTLFEGFSQQIYSKSNESSDDDSALAAKSTKRLTEWENEKYRLLLDDLIEWKGHKLYRIQYKKKIVDSDGFATRPGDLGGYIESLDNLSEKGSCVVFDNAKVWGNAKVHGHAQVWGNAQIYDDAEVCGKSYVGDNAEVYEDAKVYTNAGVHGDARIYGNAEIFGNAWVYGNAKVHGHAQVTGGIVYGGDLIK